MLEKIVQLIFCHLLGDYFLQTENLSKRKSEDWYHMFIHCALYSLPFYICFGFVWQLAVIFVSHMIVDSLKAVYHITNKTQDQVIHYLILPIYFI